MKEKRYEFQTKLYEIEKINPSFTKASCLVMHTGLNANFSAFEKSVVEKALPTMFNVPVVGYFEDNDFKGHEGGFEIEGNEITYVHKTKPIGVVSESATFEWVEVEENGEMKEYLKVDGIYLWSGRYEKECKTIIENGKSQSMEILVNDGVLDKETGYYHIQDFTFDALCVLGDDVPPCFSNASIETYSLDKDSFKRDFTLLVMELKKSIEEPIEEVQKVTIEGLLEKYSLDVSALSNIEAYEELSIEELEVKLQEFVQVEEQEVETVEESGEVDVIEEPEGETKFTRVFEIAQGDVRRKMYEKIDEHMQSKGVNGYWWIKDVYQTFFIASDDQYPQEKHYKIGYTIENDDVVLGDLEEVFPMYLTEEEKSKVEGIKAQFAALEVEVTELRAFKAEKLKQQHESDVKELLEKEVFSILEEEDVTELISNVHEFELTQIESKLYELVGRKAAQGKFSMKTKKEDKGLVTLGVDFTEDEKPRSKYADLFEKHLNK